MWLAQDHQISFHGSVKIILWRKVEEIRALEKGWHERGRQIFLSLACNTQYDVPGLWQSVHYRVLNIPSVGNLFMRAGLGGGGGGETRDPFQMTLLQFSFVGIQRFQFHICLYMHLLGDSCPISKQNKSVGLFWCESFPALLLSCKTWVLKGLGRNPAAPVAAGAVFS